ncbi:large subunit GTPase 1, partial [Tremellales sp. Uapishka_1]
MPLSRTKAQTSGLGKALIKRKAKEAVAPQESQLYTLDESNPLASVTHERDLDQFLSSAALANTDFTTERTKTRIIQMPGAANADSNPYLLSSEEAKQVAKKQVDLRAALRVPRRPHWTRKTTRLELEQQERDAFLEWRRGLADLAEESALLLTPFERNIQLWRQLWRVLERSHLIVQIVDARNPMSFRCVDLETYVQEVGSDEHEEEVTVPGKGKRKSLLLINKADLLTYEQRCAWADYFEGQGVKYAFFSALEAAAIQEVEDRQRRREEGEEESEGEDGSELESEDEEYVSGDEVEANDQDEEVLNKTLEETHLDSEEEGWSTEGEGEGNEVAGEVEKKLLQGKSVKFEEVAQEVKAESADAPAEIKEKAEPVTVLLNADGVEDARTRVLTTGELEHLFATSAPDLHHFATERDPNPSKLMVGLVGYPNVGKSSTINALLGSKKVSVSSTPGKTKHFQTLVFSDDITLCDCPGLVFPQFANTQADMVIDGVLPIDQMREYSAPVDLVCERITREILEGTYGIRIDVKEIEDGGTGKVGWEDLLSTYAIARGLTRASFGMPDTSRAARYVLKDYVNARLVYAHPPPGWTADEYMLSSRERTLEQLEVAFLHGKKRAPTTHVGKNSDTYVKPAGSGGDAILDDQQPVQEKQRQLTSASIKSTAASAPMRSGKQKAAGLDNVFFNEAGPAPRPVVKGRMQGGADLQEGGFSRPMMYAHQRLLGPDGMPLLDGGKSMRAKHGLGDKKHFKHKEGKKRSGRGYD